MSVLHDRSAADRARGRGRAVLRLPVPGRPRLDPRPPVLAVRGARRTQPADHRQGRRRRQCRAAQPAPGHPGAGRGTVRPAQRPRPDPAQGGPDRRRRRRHPAAGAGRGARLRPRRRRAAVPLHRPSRCSSGSCRRSRPSAAWRCSVCRATGAHRGRGSATGVGAVRRPGGAAPTGCPTSPTATCSSAGPRPGPTTSAARPRPPACLRTTSTSRPSGGDRHETNRPVADEHADRARAALRLPHVHVVGVPPQGGLAALTARARRSRASGS